MMSPQEHEVHMQKMTEGLQQIMQSESLDQAKSIAQGLLGEETAEQKADEPKGGEQVQTGQMNAKEALKAKLMESMQ